jgi:hypothetical protein
VLIRIGVLVLISIVVLFCLWLLSVEWFLFLLISFEEVDQLRGGRGVLQVPSSQGWNEVLHLQ